MPVTLNITLTEDLSNSLDIIKVVRPNWDLNNVGSKVSIYLFHNKKKYG